MCSRCEKQNVGLVKRPPHQPTPLRRPRVHLRTLQTNIAEYVSVEAWKELSLQSFFLSVCELLAVERSHMDVVLLPSVLDC